MGKGLGTAAGALTSIGKKPNDNYVVDAGAKKLPNQRFLQSMS